VGPLNTAFGIPPRSAGDALLLADICDAAERYREVAAARQVALLERLGDCGIFLDQVDAPADSEVEGPPELSRHT
jgi:hypothetical protein